MLRFVILAALLAGPAPALAQAAAQSVASAASALPDADLEGARGGFTILGGQELNFSAVMRSYVDGSMVLESRVSVGDQGRLLSSSATGEPLAASMLDGLAAAGLTLGTSADGSPTYVSDDNKTVFVHRAADGQLANLLVNTASQRDLRQETALTLDLPGFDVTQSAMRESLAARALANDLRTALIGR